MTVSETNHYYPFGGVFASTGNMQPYKYNGKELDTKKGLNWYDYGARHYDAALGRFTTIDPKAEDLMKWSLYSYCYDNPIKFVDPDGMQREYTELYNYHSEQLGDELSLLEKHGIIQSKIGIPPLWTIIMDMLMNPDNNEADTQLRVIPEFRQGK